MTTGTLSPRLHRRGPIEAAIAPFFCDECSDLHAFTGVAQLKRLCPVDVAGTRPHLHAFTGVAQLKLIRDSLCPEIRMGYLHAFTGVAQLKRVGWEETTSGVSIISTPSPAWPN